MEEQLFKGKKVPWSQLENYLDTHQKVITPMLELLKAGVMKKSDIEKRLPNSFF
jgi:hypothetical protein